MTAAIIALQAFRNIQHVASQQPPPEAAANRLYSSWVRDIDITRLLETDDPRELTAVQSLLCCKVLDEIVDKAFVGFTPDKKRPWIGSDDDPLRVVTSAELDLPPVEGSRIVCVRAVDVFGFESEVVISNVELQQ